MAENTFKTVRTIIAATFNINKHQITPKTSSDDIEQWDSLDHIRLILNLESAFNVKFNTVVIPKLTSISIIIAEIKRKK